jgi:fatty acid desaturase
VAELVEEADPRDALEASRGHEALGIDPATLRALHERRPGLVLGKAALLLGLTGGLAALAHLSPWIVALPLYVALGFVTNGLVQLGHEAWHHNLFRRPWQNDAFGHLFSVLFGVSFAATRHAHLRHHWYNRTSRDPDAYNAGQGLTVWLQFYVVVFAGLILAPLHFNLLYPLSAFERKDWIPHGVALAAYSLVYGGLLVAVLWVPGAGEWLWALWIVPLLCATPWNGLKSIADHYNNRWEGDRFHTATTVRTWPLVDFFWHGLNYHLDHHLYPRVPGHNLARLHALLAPRLAQEGAPVFDGYARTFWRALVAGPTYTDAPSPMWRRP